MTTRREFLLQTTAAGVDTIIDLTPADACRDVRFGQRSQAGLGCKSWSAPAFVLLLSVPID